MIQRLFSKLLLRSATKTSVVKRGIQSVIDSCKTTQYWKYEILVVTEDPKDTQTLESMPCKVLCVEKSFT